MPFFSKAFKTKKAPAKTFQKPVEHTNGHITPSKPKYGSSWDSTQIVPEEVEELIHACTLELKSRASALDTPFLLLPFRPETDVTPARTFIRNYFKYNREGLHEYRGPALQKELRLTEPEILCSIVKWCWSRIPDGVVSWSVYEGFKIGEQESNMARNAFDTFVPMGVESTSRKNIIYDFFDLLASIAAHGKVNGLGGRKLSRMAGWWAFEQSDSGNGFDGGYKTWADSADASSHLFFGYLRSRAPEAVDGISGISNLPRSLQALVAQTEYPPVTPVMLQTPTSKVVMMVDSVSPTPFALLRKAKNFQYRSEDEALQHFSEYNDPVSALTRECVRVLDCVASTNQSAARSRRGNLANARLPSGNLAIGDDSWARFQDEGFSFLSDDAPATEPASPTSNRHSPQIGGLQAEARSRGMKGDRPTTPSWADFLNTGFVDDNGAKTAPALTLPPEKQLPPIGPGRSGSTYGGDNGDETEAGELASIMTFDLDDTFWWVWMTSLANEEPAGRKAAFGRCALIETSISGGHWFVMEEQVKGATPEPVIGAYIAEKKSRFGFSRRNRSMRKKSVQPQLPEHVDSAMAAFRATSSTPSKGGITLDQQAKIKAAAAELSQRSKIPTITESLAEPQNDRRGRIDDAASTKTNSVLTLGLTNTANSALKWASAYDKQEIRRQYLGDNFAGRGLSTGQRASLAMSSDFDYKSVDSISLSETVTRPAERNLPALPAEGERPELAKMDTSEVLPAPLPPQPHYHEPAVIEEQYDTQGSRAIEVPLPPVTPHEGPADVSTEPHMSEEPEVPEVPQMPPPQVPEVKQEVRPDVMPQEEPLPHERDTPMQEDGFSSSAQLYQAKQEVLGSPSNAPLSPRLVKVERKPVNTANVHPAFRASDRETADISTTSKQPGPSSPAQVAAVRAFWQNQGSNEQASNPNENRKLHKKTGGPSGGGFKKMFGRKKDDPKSTANDISAQKNALQSPSESSVGRRISLLRKKPSPKTFEASPAVPEIAPVALAAEHERPLSSAPHGRPSVSEYAESEGPAFSQADTLEQEQAHDEFSRFDQGPLMEAPAFVPDISADEEHDLTPFAQRHEPDNYVEAYQRPPASQHASVYATPMEDAPNDHTGYNMPEEDDVESPGLATDRWAQIRKNAAERAARQSEEHSMRSRGQSFVTQNTEGASETSNEESIEDRVARIKARVAHLTSNIGPSPTEV